MSNGPRKINWQQFTADRDAEAGIEIDAPTGAPFFIPPAERWIGGYRAAKTDDDRGTAVLGKDWARWVKAGRTFAELDAAVAYAERVTPGE